MSPAAYPGLQGNPAPLEPIDSRANRGIPLAISGDAVDSLGVAGGRTLKPAFFGGNGVFHHARDGGQIRAVQAGHIHHLQQAGVGEPIWVAAQHVKGIWLMAFSVARLLPEDHGQFIIESGPLVRSAGRVYGVGHARGSQDAADLRVILQVFADGLAGLLPILLRSDLPAIAHGKPQQIRRGNRSQPLIHLRHLGGNRLVAIYQDQDLGGIQGS